MMPFSKRFLLLKVVFSLFLIVSIPLLFPQITSQPIKSYLCNIDQEEKSLDSLYSLKESNFFNKEHQFQGLFDWIIMILQFILTMIQKLIVLITKAIQLVSLLERVIDAIQVLINVINQLIQAILDIFDPDLTKIL